MQKQRKGYILVDSLIGIIIISVALVAIAGMFMQGPAANKLGNDQSIAYNLARQKIEALKTDPTELNQTLNTANYITTSTEPNLTASGSTNSNETKFTRVTQAKIPNIDSDTNTTTNINNKLIQIQVIVSWQDPKTATPQIAVTTILEK